MPNSVLQRPARNVGPQLVGPPAVQGIQQHLHTLEGQHPSALGDDPVRAHEQPHATQLSVHGHVRPGARDEDCIFVVPQDLLRVHRSNLPIWADQHLADVHIGGLGPAIIHPSTHPDPNLPRRPAQPGHKGAIQGLAALPGHLRARLPILEVGPVSVGVLRGHKQGRPGCLGLAHPPYGDSQVFSGVVAGEELGAGGGPGGAKGHVPVKAPGA
mmetsp:Transcript_57065/g.125153  ORF Transcript_57065/g.125153 Transcript_57065/m.125153 type:complete len:213 (-) Transcript_57065:18-656(-)